jgi:anti-sigma-K factor RskA
LQAQKMNNFDAAEAFAITLENKGGSATPTLSEMYVMAKVS